MNKRQLLQEFEALDFVEMLLETKQTKELPHGLNVYAQYYLESVGTIAEIKSIGVYVKNEGKPTEIAFYIKGEPQATLKHPLEVLYAEQMKALNGKVIDYDKDYIVFEGYEENAEGVMVKKAWMVRDDDNDGTAEVKEVTK